MGPVLKRALLSYRPRVHDQPKITLYSTKSCSIMLTLSGPPSTPQVPDPLTDYRRRCAGPIQRYRLTLTLVTCSGTLCETV